jgi:dynamin 1-like protein
MAICPANVDIANTDALKIARRVDPMGERTVGVLTKVDLMDEGTNCLDIIRGKVYPLKLGFIPVVCRSQKNILEGKNITNALNDEKTFFKQNETYGPMSNMCGISYLCRNLNENIIRHVKKCLPVIRSKITSLLF